MYERSREMAWWLSGGGIRHTDCKDRAISWDGHGERSAGSTKEGDLGLECTSLDCSWHGSGRGESGEKGKNGKDGGRLHNEL